MKTAISIPDNLFKNAEKISKKLGISRSSLFSTAIREYLESYTPSQITEKLNLIYEKESSELENNISKMQFKTLKTEKW